MRDMISAEEACRIIADSRGSESPIAKTTLYRGIAAGRYPPPYKLSPRVSRWSRSELESDLRKLLKRRAG